MSSRVLQVPARSEGVALLASSSEPLFRDQHDSVPKPQGRFDDRINPRWLRIAAAVKYSGINRSRLFKLIAEGGIRTACLKEHRGAKRGVRLIDRLSLDLYLETLCQPLEERLVQQSQELMQQEADLAQQHKTLVRRQEEIRKQLAAVRERS
jgi:hypothetical protein